MIGRILTAITILLLMAGTMNLAQADTPEETYQAALMKEKGEGDLKEAIRLYREVIKEKEKAGDALAARAQLRLGLCEEKLGLRKAEDEYVKVVEEYPEQKESVLPAAERIVSVEEQQADIARTEHKVERAEYFGKTFDEEEELEEVLNDIAYEAKRALTYAGRELSRELRTWSTESRPSSRKRYGEYAFRTLKIPYEHKIVADVPLRWKFAVDYGSASARKERKWYTKDFDDSKWSDIMIGQAWEDQGYEGYDEGAWYRTTVKIDGADKDRPIYMAFGGVDKDGWIYVNGKFVGEHHVWDRPFVLDISDAANYDGDNVIAIRVYDGAGMGGVYGLINIHQPTGDVNYSRYLVKKGRWQTSTAREFRPDVLMKSIEPITNLQRSSYAGYAYAPYDHETVADVPLKWKFTLVHGPMVKAYDGKKVSKEDFDDSKWSDIMIGRAWEDQGYEGYDEGAWYRTTVEIHDTDKDRPIYMAFGGLDEDGWIYVNGKFVGEHHVWNRPFVLNISDAANYDGDNVIAIRVQDSAGMGGIYGLISIHQPTDVKKASRHLATAKGSGVLSWSKRLLQRLSSRDRDHERYGSYAFTKARLPYPNKTVAHVPLTWRFILDRGPLFETYDGEKLSSKDFDDSKWSDIMIGQAWEDQGYEGYDEGAWYRTTVKIEDADKDRPIYMAFGGVDKDGWIYVNGKFVGEHHVWNRPFVLDISDAANYDGENVIAIRVYDGQAMGGIYGLINIHQPTGAVEMSRYLIRQGNIGGSTRRVDEYLLGNDEYLRRIEGIYRGSGDPGVGVPPHDHTPVADVPWMWKFKTDPRGTGEWMHPTFDDSKWEEIRIGYPWEQQGYDEYDGMAWYRTELDIDAEKEKPIYALFRGVGDHCWVYLNGKLVGEHHSWDIPFTLELTDAASSKGQNTLAIRVYDQGHTGGIYQPITIYQMP